MLQTWYPTQVLLQLVDVSVFMMTQVWVMVFLFAALGQVALESAQIQNCLLRAFFESAISARSHLNALASYVWRWIIFPFCQHVYLHAAPPIGWGGQDRMQVCASLTRLDTADLSGMNEACDKRIQREVYGYLVVIELAVFVCLAYKYATRWLRMTFSNRSASTTQAQDQTSASKSVVPEPLLSSPTGTSSLTSVVDLVDAVRTSPTCSLRRMTPKPLSTTSDDQADAASPPTVPDLAG